MAYRCAKGATRVGNEAQTGRGIYPPFPTQRNSKAIMRLLKAPKVGLWLPCCFSEVNKVGVLGRGNACQGGVKGASSCALGQGGFEGVL